MTESDANSDVVGVDAPIHRRNSTHPLTGHHDSKRENVGDRRRVEQLEFKVGHVICGHRSSISGEYCLNEPEQGQMRCGKHQATIPPPHNLKPTYSMTSHVFQRCNQCRLKECGYRNEQTGGNECVIERDLYENLNEEIVKFVTYGEATKHLFEQLVWTRVLLYRAFAQLACEGLTVTEVSGFAQVNGDITPITNDREHPVLKHIAKLQQVDRQLCDALELTPSAMTKKGESNSTAQTQNNLSELLKKAFQKFGENSSRTEG